MGSLQQTGKPIQGGVYRHFKGNEYIVLAIAKHTETEEELIVYMPVQMGQVWARPLSSWIESAPTGEPRFKLLTAPSTAIYSDLLEGDRNA